MQVSLALAFDRECVLQMLRTYHILQNGIIIWSETKYNERLAKDRVLRGKWQDVQRHVRPVGLLREPSELLIHDHIVADAAPEHRLVKHNGQLQGRRPCQHPLTLHPDPDQPLNHTGSDRLDLGIAADNMPSISLGLQKPGDDLDVPDSH